MKVIRMLRVFSLLVFSACSPMAQVLSSPPSDSPDGATMAPVADLVR
ncbi:MAG TPA: hypothetical protein VEI52_26165 [Terriglobales bacterium]|nr:hypothetical protein [Terriglobales bacterium]